MILIFSDKNDISALKVSRWIRHLGEESMIISEDDLPEVRFIDIVKGTFELGLNNQVIKSADIKAVWIRKCKLNIAQKAVRVSKHSFKHLEKRVNEYLYYENKTIADFIHELVCRNTFCLCNNSLVYVNKLSQLYHADKAGLTIPESFIFQDKQVKDYIKQKRKYISKGIFESLLINDGEIACWSGTEMVKNERVFKNQFGNSLFQAYIEKKYEIRIFYIMGRIFPMCIFSQNNPKTKIDFRNYDRKKPNRMVPYRLPVEIKRKIRKLMNMLKLNTGSLDFIVTPADDFVFLEVNPVGQFGFVSDLCNYDIEKEIAGVLMNAR